MWKYEVWITERPCGDRRFVGKYDTLYRAQEMMRLKMFNDMDKGIRSNEYTITAYREEEDYN